MKKTIFLLFLISTLIIIIYISSNPIKYIDIDGEKFMVRNINNSFQAGNLLCTIKKKLTLLIDRCMEDPDETYYKYVKVIHDRLPSCEFKETSWGSIYVTFTHLKGKSMTVCMRSKDGFQDLNELMYVCIHEIAHIGCPEMNHTDLFYEINEYLLLQAIKYNIYTFVDYEKTPKDHCGILIDNNIVKKYV